ncbi:hypothetical protein Tco_0615753 [Tanacetum coccineum]
MECLVKRFMVMILREFGVNLLSKNQGDKCSKEMDDADYVRCKETFKSISGGAQFLGKKLVSWSSKKQDCTMLSTAEGELFGDIENSQCVIIDFSNTLIEFSMVLWLLCQNWRDLPRDTLIDRVEVPSYDKQRTSSKNVKYKISNRSSHNMMRKIVSLQVMPKDEYVGKEVFQSKEVSMMLSRLKSQDIKIKDQDPRS